MIEDIRAIVPIDTDVTEKDRLEQIEDRSGNILFTGPLGIEAVQRHQTHKELHLIAVSS